VLLRVRAVVAGAEVLTKQQLHLVERHGHTSSSKTKRTPDGVDLAYSLNCHSSSLRYDRATLLRHDDAVVRQIAAILPV
jgi:hypothetical protein